jgi:hypothetical protein
VRDLKKLTNTARNKPPITPWYKVPIMVAGLSLYWKMAIVMWKIENATITLRKLCDRSTEKDILVERTPIAKAATPYILDAINILWCSMLAHPSPSQKRLGWDIRKMPSPASMTPFKSKSVLTLIIYEITGLLRLEGKDIVAIVIPLATIDMQY